MKEKKVKVLITGVAGFIGFHLSKLLLDEGFLVSGYDGITDYYDVSLKNSRLKILNSYGDFTFTKGMLEDAAALREVAKKFRPNVIVHLAAQAGVRYSLENPGAYIQSNVVGTLNVMDIAKNSGVDHLLMASTSSVYGANTTMPFREIDKTETPLTIYAATKKANENMGHAYAHLWNIPTTMFRFFTVYGPWGRPDMALFKFTKAILNGDSIDVYNHGEMFRDFTYVDDLVRGIRLLIDTPPDRICQPQTDEPETYKDSLSPVAPFRTINIGNSDKVRLLDFVDALEEHLGKKAFRNYMPMQPGDVPATWADATLLKNLTGYKPNTNFKDGIKAFVDWYVEYYSS
jgi:UDP-glucuronate 4-epimerase